jgi:hypothetical protein
MDGSATPLVAPCPQQPGPAAASPFELELLQRLPLAQAILLLFSHVLPTPQLRDIYEHNRGRCYTRKLSFPDMVHLIRDALLLHQGSGRGSFTEAQAQERLPSSVRAVYGKLGRMPLAVSMAVLRVSLPALRQVLPPAEEPEPSSLNGFQCIIVDGKTLKHVARRLKILRNRRGRINSGKLLVALELDRGLALAFNASRSSEANDVSLVDGLLLQLEPAAEQFRLFIGDRQFCDLPRLVAFSAGGNHFLIRHNRSIYFHPDPARPACKGIDRRGRHFVQEWGWLGDAAHPLRRYVRRITLCREGEKDVAVVSDLLEETEHPADDLLEAYLHRWGIERVFQQITEVFDLRSLIGGDPKATIFQASFCLLMYNLTQVVRAHVAGAGKKRVAEVSTEKLFGDCRSQLLAWAAAGNPQAAIELLAGPADPPRVLATMHRLLGSLWKPRWLKAPAQPNRVRTKTTVYPRKGYTNVGKLQNALAESATKRQRGKQRCS